MDKIEEKLNRLEDNIKVKFFEVEKKFANIESTGSVAILDRIQELEDLLLLIQVEITKVKEARNETFMPAMEENVGTIQLPANIEQRLGRIEDELSSLQDKSAHEIEAEEIEINDEKPTMKKEVIIKEQKIDTKEIERNIEQRVQAKISETENNLRNAISRLEKYVESPQQKFSDKAAQQYIDKMNSVKREIEEKIGGIEAVKSKVEGILNIEKVDLENIQKSLNEQQIGMSRADAIYSKLRALEDKIKSDLDRLEILKGNMETSTKNSFDRLEQKKSEIESRIRGMEEKFYSQIQKLDSERESMDSRMGMIESGIKQMKELGLDEGPDELKKRLEKDMRAKINEMEKYLGETTSRFSARLNEVKSRVDEEAKELSKIMGSGEIKKLRDDIYEQKKNIDGFEKKLEMIALKTTTKQLEEYSKMLDKKLPEIMTKEDYQRIMNIVNQRIKMPDIPDLKIIKDRVGVLEKNIEQIAAETRSIYGRLPFIVE